jgi:hypothetical protein
MREPEAFAPPKKMEQAEQAQGQRAENEEVGLQGGNYGYYNISFYS